MRRDGPTGTNIGRRDRCVTIFSSHHHHPTCHYLHQGEDDDEEKDNEGDDEDGDEDKDDEGGDEDGDEAADINESHSKLSSPRQNNCSKLP